MKAKQLIKLLGLSLFFICGTVVTASAKQDKNNIFYNVEEKNGTLVGKTLYKENGKMLSELAKYSYTFNEDYRIIQNSVSVWNNDANKWERGFLVRYDYKDQNTTVEYYKWNREKGVYELDKNKEESFIDYTL